MPKSKDPSSYPQSYIDLFERALTTAHTIPGLSKNQAVYLRQDLYAFRTALKENGAELGVRFAPVQIKLAKTDPFTNGLEAEWNLTLVSVDLTSVNEAILKSLGVTTPPNLDEQSTTNPSAAPTRDEMAILRNIGILPGDD